MNRQPPAQILAWRELMHVHSSVTRALDEKLKSSLGIPITWYEALVEIALAGGHMRMNEFAAETTLTKSGATRFVDRLATAGLVERTMCPTDRRAWQLSLTPAGKQIQRAADPHVLAVINEFFGSFLDDHQALLMYSALHRMRAATVAA